MAEFTITITDANKLSGITSARLRYNDDNPEAPIDTDEAYVQFVMDGAAASYAAQYAT